MSVRVLLGLAIGIVVSLLSWQGNQTDHSVSTLPDLFTFLVLVGLTCGAVWFCARRSPLHNSATVWKVGGTVAATAGILFGMAIVLIGLARFGQPRPHLLIFGFLTAFGSALLCGAVASALVSYLLARREEEKAT